MTSELATAVTMAPSLAACRGSARMFEGGLRWPHLGFAYLAGDGATHDRYGPCPI